MVDDFELIKREYAINQWIQKSEEATDDKFKLDLGEMVMFDAEKGFVTYRIDAKRKQLFASKICGDGLHWLKFLRTLFVQCRDEGIALTRYIWNTPRNPQAMIRLYDRHLPDTVSRHLETIEWKGKPLHRMATYFRNEVQQWQA